MNRTCCHGARNAPAGVADDAPLLAARRCRCSALLGAALAPLLFVISLPVLPAAGQATITVTSTADTAVPFDAQCTLREAITNANTNTDTTANDCAAGTSTGTDTIAFNLVLGGGGGGPVRTIKPGSALPVITDPVVIDGETFGGADCGSDIASRTLTVELDGSSSPSGSGLALGAGSDGSTIRGLVINQWPGHGVQISGSADNVVECNFIGTDVGGTVDLGNTFYGVYIEAAIGNTIGGAAAGAGNLISGNNFHGVRIDFGSDNTTVAGNYIGTDASGTAALGNAATGVYISIGTGNTIGGTVAGARNVISGNDQNGIRIDTDDNTVTGNYIGTDASGTAALGNFDIGVYIFSGSGNTIGSAATGARNVISGNNQHGVLISTFSANTTVAGNYIGTDASGTTILGNTLHGVFIQGSATGNTIGGTTAGARNVISGNNSSGVRIGASDDNTVAGNYIGTDVTGTTALGNSGGGVSIGNGATGNTIGGEAADARNVISGNNSSGVDIVASDDNTVAGNYIGTDATGTADLGNSSSGVYIDNLATGNTIGGTAEGARNVISGNKSDGVRIEESANNNTVAGNYIGTDVTGSANLRNILSGVFINGSGNTIGGTATGARNVISGNGTFGVVVGGNNNSVEANYIGTDVTGTSDLGNTLSGVYLFGGATGNAIGGDAVGARNVISGNNSSGVGIDGSDNNTIAGNYIGTDVTGFANLRNNGRGVTISNGASNNTIGGTGAGAGNTVAFNQDGIVLAASAGTGNAIERNGLFENVEIGIDLGDDDMTPNDAGDADTGPNNLQNFPTLTAIISSANLLVTYSVDSDLTNATYPISVEVFEADADDEEGKTFLGSGTYTTTDRSVCGTLPCPKTVNFGAAASLGVSLGDRLVATATDSDGNTSEFSLAVVVFAIRYVSTTGADTGNDCTDPANPCATLGHAVAQAHDGDTIDVAAGTYSEAGLVLDKALHFQGQGWVVQ